MPSFSTPAILIRRLDYGDFDLILTFLTLNYGKMTAIAKSAKRSTKRFSGILELFYFLNIVVQSSQKKGMPVLGEASLNNPLEHIRADITKTAYASYWAELINGAIEDGGRQEVLYHLLEFVLKSLDTGDVPDEVLSILFQMRFLTIAGLCPNLKFCCNCRSDVSASDRLHINFDLAKGGLICEDCTPYGSKETSLSKGTIKQLLWLNECEIEKTGRIRFSPAALQESQRFLEAFVPYHLGREPKSLRFLRQIRSESWKKA